MNVKRRQLEDPQQPSFGFCPQMIPQGDGSFLIKAGKPVEKLTAREAARRARCDVSTVYRLFHGGLIEGERPSPRKILVYADSFERHLRESRDPEFWEDRKRHKQFTDAI